MGSSIFAVKNLDFGRTFISAQWDLHYKMKATFKSETLEQCEINKNLIGAKDSQNSAMNLWFEFRLNPRIFPSSDLESLQVKSPITLGLQEKM